MNLAAEIVLLAVLFICLLLSDHCCHSHEETVSEVNTDEFEVAKDRRYLLYDSNHGEGFNLRRDVHMRIANFVRLLREKGENFILVLPPWGGHYHWQTRSIGEQVKIPWGLWFDMPSINRFVPSIEFEQFLEETGKKSIDQIFYLQHYAEGWGKGWKEKFHYRPCIEAEERYYEWDKEEKAWYGWFWGYGNSIVGKRMECISIQGQSSTLLKLVLQPNITAQSVMIDRGETVLHDYFGDVWYWKARRSMRYSKELRDLGDDFREKYLDSTDEKDGTVLKEDWTETKVTPGQAKGGPYLGVHLRRKDFVRAHGKEIPSLEGAAKQINKLMEEQGLTKVFLSSDAPPKEVEELRGMLAENVELFKYDPSQDVLEKFKDGGVSIVDQWIAAHARYFIGSHVSTFSFRIQDEREILGFDPDTTFHRLCPDRDIENGCEQPSQWKLVQE